MGVPAEMNELFNALSDSLPGWTLPTPDGSPEPSGSLPSSSALEAMRKIISLASDSAESSKRFQDLAYAGIKQFNDGVLARAAVIFDLAKRLVQEKTLSPSSIEEVHGKAYELLDQERLRRLAESPEKHIELRRILTFFQRLSPEGLLDDLYQEQQRDRRRLLVALMEVHGENARAACLERLSAAVVGSEETDAVFLRDLIHLLRTIPPVDDDSLEHEIELVASVSPQDEEELLKEAIGYLGEKKHEKSVSALISYLRMFEEMLVGGVAEQRQSEAAGYRSIEPNRVHTRSHGHWRRHGSRARARAQERSGARGTCSATRKRRKRGSRRSVGRTALSARTAEATACSQTSSTSP